MPRHHKEEETDARNFERDLNTAGAPQDVANAMLSIYSTIREIRGAGDKSARELTYEIARHVACG